MYFVTCILIVVDGYMTEVYNPQTDAEQADDEDGECLPLFTFLINNGIV